jgi:O-acetyl-ADP-ribose deacetylase (regulator of RNase III)
MKQINNIKIDVKNGNVATENVECIVVPEFNSCASYGGVGYAIKVAGMGAGLETYDKVASDKPFNYGDVLITESGKSGIKLAHVATAGANADEQFAVVVKAMFQVLLSANSLGLRTIAVPEIGTGIIGTLTPEQSAKAIFGAVAKFTERFPENLIQEVTLVIYRDSTAPAEKVLSEQSYIEKDGCIKDMRGEKEFNIAEWLQGMGLLG